MHVRAAPSSSRFASGSKFPFFAGTRASRVILFLLIVALHLLVIAWLASGPVKTMSKPVETVLSMSAMPQAKPPAPSHQTAVARRTVKVLAKSPVVDQAQVPSVGAAGSPPATTAVSATGDHCDLITGMQSAIEHDPAAMAELASVPPGVRTEADAIMLWNGKWLELASPPAPGGGIAGVSSELRNTILLAVNSASAACRDEPVVGPLFLSVPEAGRTTMLVIGSGAWRWSDLLSPAQICGAVGSQTCPTTAKPPLTDQ